ncbi:MAG: hypothetical protein V3U71_13185 [Cocleimonas sp.]
MGQVELGSVDYMNNKKYMDQIQKMHRWGFVTIFILIWSAMSASTSVKLLSLNISIEKSVCFTYIVFFIINLRFESI